MAFRPRPCYSLNIQAPLGLQEKRHGLARAGHLQIFQQPEWQAQAAQPGILEQLGRTWDQTLATKGQALRAYLADLQLAYRMLRDPNFQLDQATKITLIIALLYIVSPIDVIPDGIPYDIGHVDSQCSSCPPLKNP